MFVLFTSPTGIKTMCVAWGAVQWALCAGRVCVRRYWENVGEGWFLTCHIHMQQTRGWHFPAFSQLPFSPAAAAIQDFAAMLVLVWRENSALPICNSILD